MIKRLISYIRDIADGNNSTSLLYASFLGRRNFCNWSNCFLKVNFGDAGYQFPYKKYFSYFSYAKQDLYLLNYVVWCSLYFSFKISFECFLPLALKFSSNFFYKISFRYYFWLHLKIYRRCIKGKLFYYFFHLSFLVRRNFSNWTN